MSLLCLLPGLPGMFQSLFGEFVSVQVILLAVMFRRGLMGMCGKQVEFRCTMM
jgi:hypothetical protein